MAEQKNKGNQIAIDLPEDVAEGIYTNLAMISHSQGEFVLDFIRMVPNVPKAKVKSRVIMTPQHAKRLLKALNDNIAKYENQHGTIGGSDSGFPPFNFSAPKAQA